MIRLPIRLPPFVLVDPMLDSAAAFPYNARMIKSIFAICVFTALSCVFAYSEDTFSAPPEASLSDNETPDAERSPNSFFPYLAGSGEYFVLNPITDPILVGSGIGLFVVDLNLHRFKNDRSFDGSLYNRDDVSAFDRWAMQPYSRALDITGDVFIGCTMATPLVFASSANGLRSVSCTPKRCSSRMSPRI